MKDELVMGGVVSGGWRPRALRLNRVASEIPAAQRTRVLHEGSDREKYIRKWVVYCYIMNLVIKILHAPIHITSHGSRLSEKLNKSLLQLIIPIIPFML